MNGDSRICLVSLPALTIHQKRKTMDILPHEIWDSILGYVRVSVEFPTLPRRSYIAGHTRFAAYLTVSKQWAVSHVQRTTYYNRRLVCRTLLYPIYIAICISTYISQPSIISLRSYSIPRRVIPEGNGCTHCRLSLKAAGPAMTLSTPLSTTYPQAS